MDVCPLCLRASTIRAHISSLPCNHAFHNHCVIRWLLKTKSCPLRQLEVDTTRKKKRMTRKKEM
ncbi:E3 ubiquitin-protein ligase rnf126-b [Phtheirospermum japonicum]|uniref:E3 ubiquitin-protein ligase rnf126-b n=1 Tax=Phtheirospermum japonicum TaxID=374723 RepID=A0A830BFG7_9LAMI|nr:E3 ubiquitin-protein ligase rnf126-b [Phtheirospermum japonicum]